ncbi:hypothetical protein B0H10DRAFT_1942158 [Mycena sp. CBHHK59/15]|nr:hypothetical protein B0H10DRAFT_1942158 [Mycena sp. CBHHK59/15]
MRAGATRCHGGKPDSTELWQNETPLLVIPHAVKIPNPTSRSVIDPYPPLCSARLPRTTTGSATSFLFDFVIARLPGCVISKPSMIPGGNEEEKRKKTVCSETLFISPLSRTVRSGSSNAHSHQAGPAHLMRAGTRTRRAGNGMRPACARSRLTDASIMITSLLSAGPQCAAVFIHHQSGLWMEVGWRDGKMFIYRERQNADLPFIATPLQCQHAANVLTNALAQTAYRATAPTSWVVPARRPSKSLGSRPDTANPTFHIDHLQNGASGTADASQCSRFGVSVCAGYANAPGGAL